MIAKTTLSAVRALSYLSCRDAAVALSPRRIAAEIGESPSYLAKVFRHLVKSGILRAEKGVKGGVRLVQPPREVTLLSVVEACQGTITGDYCTNACPDRAMCGFHEATLELHRAICGILSRWTLADILEKPGASADLGGRISCLMEGASRPSSRASSRTAPHRRARTGGRKS
jgi:Rrf2 family protein